jgi:hypothetical protein
MSMGLKYYNRMKCSAGPFQCNYSDLLAFLALFCDQETGPSQFGTIEKKIISIEFSLDEVVFGKTLLPTKFKRGNLQVPGIGI